MTRWAVLLLFAFLVGCSTPTKVIRLDTGLGEPGVYVPRRDVEPVELSEEELEEVVAEHAASVPVVVHPLEYARQLFGVPERSGWFRYEEGAGDSLPRSRGTLRTCTCYPRMRN
ncbi:hypothetical protein [Archangium gephyra]|uniref:hypothetical protein n=1 Tax=Archangium gephyra TaxID=48 RepID=UPI001FDF79AC|nr:hypothetical protein [Archangium gephyra]